MAMFGIGKEELNEVKNSVVVVEKNVVSLDKKVEDENKALKVELLEARREVTNVRKENIELSKRLQIVEEWIALNKAEEQKRIADEIDEMKRDAKFKGEWLTVKNMCELTNISNETMLRYYLYKTGVMKLNINPQRNTFLLASTNVNDMPEYIRKYFGVDDNGKLLLHVSFEEYILNNIQDIKAAYEETLRKDEEYKETKSRLESVNVENYRKEINRILGVGTNYDGSKWSHVFRVFKMAKENKNFDKNFKAYNRDVAEIKPFEYVCTVLNQGNYFLKVVCELYA